MSSNDYNTELDRIMNSDLSPEDMERELEKLNEMTNGADPVRKAEFGPIEADPEPGVSNKENIRGSVLAIPVKVEVVIGRKVLAVNDLLDLRRGVVVDLDKMVDEPADIMVNGKVLARGELVIFEGEKLGVTLTEIVKGDPA